MKRSDIFLLILFLLGVAITTSVIYRQVKSEWITYRRGQHLYRNDQYTEAIECFQQSLDGGIAPPEMMRQLGTSYQKTGQADKIKAAFTRYLDNSGHPQHLYDLATNYEADGKLDLAGFAYRSIVEERPWEKNVRIRLARVLTWTDRMNQAARQYRIALNEEQP